MKKYKVLFLVLNFSLPLAISAAEYHFCKYLTGYPKSSRQALRLKDSKLILRLKDPQAARPKVTLFRYHGTEAYDWGCNAYTKGPKDIFLRCFSPSFRDISNNQYFDYEGLWLFNPGLNLLRAVEYRYLQNSNQVVRKEGSVFKCEKITDIEAFKKRHSLFRVSRILLYQMKRNKVRPPVNGYQIKLDDFWKEVLPANSIVPRAFKRGYVPSAE